MRLATNTTAQLCAAGILARRAVAKNGHRAIDRSCVARGLVPRGLGREGQALALQTASAPPAFAIGFGVASERGGEPTVRHVDRIYLKPLRAAGRQDSSLV